MSFVLKYICAKVLVAHTFPPSHCHMVILNSPQKYLFDELVAALLYLLALGWEVPYQNPKASCTLGYYRRAYTTNTIGKLDSHKCFVKNLCPIERAKYVVRDIYIERDHGLGYKISHVVSVYYRMILDRE